MRHAAILLLIVFGCRQAAPTKTNAAASMTDVRTIESTPTPPAPVEPPPVLNDESAAPNPISATSTAPNPVVLSPADERLRASLPFAPAIGMDPVDGSKLSIRATTPTSTYKGRIFYFTSDANKRTFETNPEQYAKGRFAHL